MREQGRSKTGIASLPSAQADWLPDGFADRVVHRCCHALPLDGGQGDHNHADSETDTATPDDCDIASLASCSFESLQPSSL